MKKPLAKTINFCYQGEYTWQPNALRDLANKCIATDAPLYLKSRKIQCKALKDPVAKYVDMNHHQDCDITVKHVCVSLEVIQ